MSENKRVVEEYMEAYNHGDHERILACLTDNVEWEVPGLFHVFGKEAFDAEIENDCFVGLPNIIIDRLTEESNVVIAEGRVTAMQKEGGEVKLKYCDVFEMDDGKIKKLISFLMTVNGSSLS